MVTYEMQMSTTQILSSYMYMFVDRCLLVAFSETVALAQCGSLLVGFGCVDWGAFTPCLFDVIQINSVSICSSACLNGEKTGNQALMCNKSPHRD